MARYKKKSKTFLKTVLVLSLSVIGLSLLIFRVQQAVPEERSEAAIDSKLTIRVSSSYVKPGGSYTLYAIKEKKINGGYTGYLEVGKDICDASGCKTVSSGIWKGFDGKNIYVSTTSKVNIPSTAGVGVYKARFKPYPNPYNLGWSNLIQVNVSSTDDLADARDYWKFWDTGVVKTFKGQNTIYNKSFETKIGYEAPVSLCGVWIRPMVFVKNNIYGYWDGATPWYNYLWTGGDAGGNPNYPNPVDSEFHENFKQDIRWYVRDWTNNNNSWADTWLTAPFFRQYKYLTPRPLSVLTFNVKAADSLDSTHPNYFLTPLYVGPGWGDAIASGMVVKGISTSNICNMAYNRDYKRIWAAHADFLTLTTTKGSFPALRLRYYEGDLNYLATTSPGNFLREDWWFIKGQGLVRIDVKSFGFNTYTYNGVTKTFPNRYPCAKDDDCLVNDIIKYPHITLTRSDYL